MRGYCHELDRISPLIKDNRIKKQIIDYLDSEDTKININK